MQSHRKGTLFGRKAVLVLSDDEGEFEIRDGLRANSQEVFIDLDRVANAITLREAGRAQPRTRPIY